MAALRIFAALAVCLVAHGQMCEDKNTEVCKDLAILNPNLCGDSCLSSICTRFCGHCPLKCYSCHEEEDPNNCTNVVECPSSDHYCFTTQTFTDDFREVYKLGCAMKSLCEKNVNSGKRSDLSVKGACCTMDNCNNNLPAVLDLLPQKSTVTPIKTTAGPITYNVCKNLDDNICLKLSLTDPSFCANDCIAEQICPRMCRKCFQCYSCNDIDSPENCNTSSTCQTGKECFLLETLSFDLRPVYRLGCLDQSLCQRFGTSPVQTGFGRRQQSLALKGGCCTTDMCNSKLSNFVQTTTPKPLTTQPPVTTTAIDCRHASTDIRYRHCPVGYTYVIHEHTCYMIGNIRNTWQQGQNYCKEHCGRLADFSDIKELTDVLDHVRSTYNNMDLWVGAIRVPNHNQWIWDDTHRLLDASLSSYLTRSSQLCAAGHNSQHSSQRLVPHSCSQHFLPLCEAHRLY